jgi:hypothetical protein
VKRGNTFINHHNRKSERKTQLCACGCGEGTKPGRKFIFMHNWRRDKEELKILNKCACGCGEIVSYSRKKRNRFISGHNSRVCHPMLGTGKIKVTQFCLCGCGNMTNSGREYIFGHHLRGDNNPQKRPEARQKVSDRLKGHVVLESTKEKIRVKRMLQIFSPEACLKMSRAQEAHWRDPEFVHNQMVGRGIRPNKPETIILNLLNQMYPNDWKYTGDFSFTINGKNPDFTNINGQKKLIELFGDYWHRGQNPEDRKKIFREFGYDTLVIWERELKNLTKVKFKIHGFMKRSFPPKEFLGFPTEEWLNE